MTGGSVAAVAAECYTLVLLQLLVHSLAVAAGSSPDLQNNSLAFCQ